MKIVDTLAEQALLEEVLETTKPPVPRECRELHYLLSTPFRYAAPYPAGSRFRRAGFTSGVFYASNTPATAVAELAFRRLLFYADSPQTPWPQIGEYTTFSVRFRTAAGLDLTLPPLSEDQELWMHRTDYGACQDLADRAREAGVEAVRYRSARTVGGPPSQGDGATGINVALLTCRAFTSREPLDRQTWRIDVGPSGVRAVCDHPDARLEFDRAAFADDPRIRALNWER
jgi:hypothetical protein